MADKCIGKLTLDISDVSKKIEDVNKFLGQIGANINLEDKLSKNISSALNKLVSEAKKAGEEAQKALQGAANIDAKGGLESVMQKVTATVNTYAREIDNVGKATEKLVGTVQTGFDAAGNKIKEFADSSGAITKRTQEIKNSYEEEVNAAYRAYEAEEQLYQKQAEAAVQAGLKREEASKRSADAAQQAADKERELIARQADMMEEDYAKRQALLEKQLSADEAAQEKMRQKSIEAEFAKEEARKKSAAAAEEAAQREADLIQREIDMMEEAIQKRQEAEQKQFETDQIERAKQAYFELTDAIKNYNAAKKAGDELGASAAQERINAAMQEVNAIQETVNASNLEANAKQQVLNTIQQCVTAEKQHSAEIAQSANRTGELDSAVNSIVTRYLSLFAVIRTINSLVDNMVEYVSEYADKMNEIQMITLSSNEEVAKLGETYRNIAKDMSVSSLDMAEAAVYFTRQGLEAADIEDRLKNVTMYAKAANVEFKDASEIITAVINSMNLVEQEAEDGRTAAQRVADVFLAIGDNAATSGQEIGEAMQKAAASAGSFGVSMEWLASYIATVSETTRQEARTIGTAFNTIIARLHQIKQTGYNQEDETKINDIAKALSKIDVALLNQDGSWRRMEDILQDVAAEWSDLDDKTKSYIATTMAGVKQQNVFLALMNDMAKGAENGSRAFELYNEAMNSNGAAAEKYGVYLDSVTAAQERLTIAQERFYSLLGEDLIKGWYNSLTGIINFFTEATEAANGLNIIIPMIIGGIGLVVVAVHNLNVKIAETGGLLALLQKHPIVSIITAVASAIALTTLMFGAWEAATETTEEKLTRLSSTISESEQAISKYQNLQSGLDAMMKDIGTDTQVTSKELKNYEDLLDDLSGVSKDAEAAVMALRSGVIDQSEAYEIINGELEKYIKNQQKIQGLAIYEKNQNRELSDAEEFAKLLMRYASYGEGTEITHGSEIVYQAPQKIKEDLEALSTLGVRWEQSLETIYDEYMGGMDFRQYLTQVANDMIDEYLNVISIAMSDIDKRSIRNMMSSIIFGDDGILDFSEYEGISEKLGQFWTQALTANFDPSVILGDRQRLTSIGTEFFGNYFDLIFGDQINSLLSSEYASETIDSISKAINTLIEEGFSNIEIADVLTNLPLNEWDTVIDVMIQRLRESIMKHAGVDGLGMSIIDLVTGEESYDLGMWEDLDIATLKVIDDLVKSGVALTDIQFAMEASGDSVDEFKTKLEAMGKAAGQGGEDASRSLKELVSDIKSYNTEIGKLEGYINTLQEGGSLSADDILGLAMAHPEITRFINDTDLMIEAIQQYKDELEGLNHDSIVEFLKNSEEFYKGTAFYDDYGDQFKTMQEFIDSLEGNAEEQEKVSEYVDNAATNLENATAAARDAAKNAKDTSGTANTTLEEYLKKYDEYTKMIEGLDKGDGIDFTDLIGLATEDVSIIDAAGDSIDALRMKLAELREAAGAGIAESIKNMIMNSEKYLASSPLASYMEFGYKSLSDLEKDAGKFDVYIEQQIKSYVAKVEAILLSESKQLGSVGKDIIGQLMTDMFSDSNVDLLNRPIVKLGEDFATVLTETLTAGTEGLEWSHDVVINLTPILPDGSELSYEEIEEYVQSLLDESNGIGELLENDKVENGGKGILISVAAASEGFEEAISNAESLAEVLHILQEAYYGVTESEKTWLQAQAEEISRQEDLNWASTNGYAEQIYALQEALSSGGASGVMDEWNAMWDESNGKMNEAISNTYPNLINALAEVESALAAKNQLVKSGTATEEELQQAEDDLAQAQSNLARELQITNEYLDATHFTETANAAKQLREGTISVTDAYAKYNKDLNNVAKAYEDVIDVQNKMQKGTKVAVSDVSNLASVLGMSAEEIINDFPEALDIFNDLTSSTGELKNALDALNEAAFIRITGTSEADFSNLLNGLVTVQDVADETIQKLLATGQFELETKELKQEMDVWEWQGLLKGGFVKKTATGKATFLKPTGNNPFKSGGYSGGGSSTPTSTGGGGGGGGGGSKNEDSYDQQILDEMDKVEKFYKSQLSYFEALEKYYDSAGLAQGVIKSLERQREVIEEENRSLENNLALVKERLDLKRDELSTLTKGSDAYNACASDVEALEDAYRSMSTEQLNNISTMNALTDSIRAQQNAIRDLQIEIKNEIYNAIEDRERRADDMLNGRVDAENMVMGLVKARYEAERDAILENVKAESAASSASSGATKDGYQDELELLKEKKEKIKENAKEVLDGLKEEYDAFQKNNKAQQDALKKEFDRISQIYKLRIDSLNEEKNLLNEQLNLRKQQYDMEDKATRLAELEAKYQRIIADPTRRKEALDIQKQIQSLRNEIAWDTAEEEVKSQQQDIDDEVKELNRELGLHKEKYEDQKEALTDALNAYKESYEEQKKLIEDTRDAQVKAIDEQIKALEKLAKAQQSSSSSMASSTSDYTKQVQQYYDDLFKHPAKLIQETEQILGMTDDEIIEWMKANDETYQNSSAATQEQMEKGWRETLRKMRGDQDDHWDEVEEIYAQGDDAIIKFLMENSDGYLNAGLLQGQKYIEGWREKLKELGLMLEPVEVMPEIDFGTAPTVNPNQTGGSSSGGNGGGTGGNGGYNGGSGAGSGGSKKDSSKGDSFADKSGLTFNLGKDLDSATEAIDKTLHDLDKKYEANGGISLNNRTMEKFATGGIADFTGPAWLDGSATMPERILSPYQTELFETMVHALESASRINVQTAPNFENLQTTGSNVSVGDIIVNVDNLDTDDDYEELAEKVGEVLMDKLGRTSVVGGIRIRSI